MTLQAFHYQPQPMWRRRTVTLEGTRLTNIGHWEIDLATIRKATFIETQDEDGRYLHLSFRVAGSGRRYHLSVTEEQDGANISAFLSMARAIIGVIALHAPDLEINLERGRLGRWVIFLTIAPLFIVPSGMFAVAGFASGQIFMNALGALAFLFFGTSIYEAIRLAPWRRPRRLPAKVLAQNF